MTGSTGKSRRAFRLIAFGVGAALSFYGYITGWPAWLVLLALCAVPAAAFCVWMYTGRLRRYRFLFGIYAVVSVIGGLEAWQYSQIPESVAQSIDLPESPGKPNLFFEYDLPGVLFELFPDEPEALLLRGTQLRFCTDEAHGFGQHPFCEKYQDAETESLRDLFEMALATEPKTHQHLYYNYVEILIQAKAPQAEIDAAAEKWKRLFPLSPRPDPRVFFAIPEQR